MSRARRRLHSLSLHRLGRLWRRYDIPPARRSAPSFLSSSSLRCRSPAQQAARYRPHGARSRGAAAAAVRQAGRPVDLSRDRHPGTTRSGCSARCPTACAMRCATTGCRRARCRSASRIDAGSLYEKPSEQGFAHLIEHLTFREIEVSRQRRGDPDLAAAGRELRHRHQRRDHARRRRSISSTCPTSSRPTLDESMKLLSGMIEAPALSEANFEDRGADRARRTARTRRRRRSAWRGRDARDDVRRAAARRAAADRHGRDAATPPRPKRSARSTTAGTGPKTPWSWSSGDYRSASTSPRWSRNGSATGHARQAGAARPTSARPGAARGRRSRTIRSARRSVLVEPGQPRGFNYAVPAARITR